MTSKIDKALDRLSDKERKAFKKMLQKVQKSLWTGLDVKKLKNENNIYRVRVGQLRALFQMKGKQVTLIAVERRSDTTYKKKR